MNRRWPHGLEKIPDDEVLGNKAFYVKDGVKYLITNNNFFRLTAKQAVKFCNKQHTEFFWEVQEAPEKRRSSLLQDDFTIDERTVDRFKSTWGRSLEAIDLIPILQQIMTNLNTVPEDKMAKTKFLEEFDKRMQNVIQNPGDSSESILW